MSDEALRKPREVCFLIGRGGAILWSDASDSPLALPDTRERWEAIWTSRAELEEVAHSHPYGPAGFSTEDETTMAAICAGLGRDVRFSVVSPGAMRRRQGRSEEVLPEEPWWAALLRLASGMPPRGSSGGAS